MNGIFSYTGLEFPKTEFFYAFDDESKKSKLKGTFEYLSAHGTVLSGNLRREFSKNVEREHGKPVSQKYDKLIENLMKSGFIVKGEMKYKIRKDGIGLISSVTRGASSCPSDFLCILENLHMLHGSKGRKPVEYNEPVEHFELLGEVETDNIDFIGKSDIFNRYMKRLSNDGFVEIIMPSDTNGSWIEWFSKYAKIENK
ncbi:MAG: hypothetical protein WA139_00045 [Candidatus Aenigmatarchaeota archaeon]